MGSLVGRLCEIEGTGMFQAQRLSIADHVEQSILRIPAIYAFDNPSPAIFVIAVAMFTFTALLVYTMHENDHLQDRFLAAGVVGAIMISSVRQSMAFDKLWARSILSRLPFSVMFALGISNIYHRTHRPVQPDSDSLGPRSEKSNGTTEQQ